MTFHLDFGCTFSLFSSLCDPLAVPCPDMIKQSLSLCLSFPFKLRDFSRTLASVCRKQVKQNWLVMCDPKRTSSVYSLSAVHDNNLQELEQQHKNPGSEVWGRTSELVLHFHGWWRPWCSPTDWHVCTLQSAVRPLVGLFVFPVSFMCMAHWTHLLLFSAFLVGCGVLHLMVFSVLQGPRWVF